MRILIIIITLLFASCYNTSLEFGNNVNEIYAQSTQSQGEEQQESFEVIIPRGAANPEVDITNLAPRQWYMPKQITITQGDNVTWINEDTEPHTVTSGIGAGIESLLTNEKGRPSGIFDSGLFRPEESWSYIFTEPGRYAYFCTVHPWMEGVIVVEEKVAVIPTYPVNASGSRIDSLPIYVFTNDDKYEIGMSWSPNAIVTGEPVDFIVTSFDWPSNIKSHLVPYDFVIMRNETEIDRISDLIEVGADTQEVVFDEPGPIRIRIENVGDTPAYSEFNTLVYENPEGISTVDTGIISEQTNVSKMISPLTLVYTTYAVIAGIPAAVAVIIILYRKGKI